MNPAALKAHLKDVRRNGTIIVNKDAFTDRNLEKAEWDGDPLQDGTLDGYRVIEVPMETLTKDAVEESGVTGRDVLRSKNMLAVGLLAWLYNRPLEPTIEWLEQKFKSKPEVVAANTAALKGGYNFGLTTEALKTTFVVEPAQLRPGTYTNISGSMALAWGLLAASQQAKLPLFYGSYPITPASDILHELSKHKNFGVRTFQAEDEIAAIGATVGAAFGGSLSVTGTSGPGLALKSEALSLAMMTELPMIVIDVQRGGPSTGLPTKPEQSDLLFALFGRHGESPVPVVACASPSDAFDAAFEAARIALKYMTPVILLSDNNVANGSEPWAIPNLDELADISVEFATAPNAPDGSFLPYLRDPETLARPWAVPGTPGLEHRIGGLESEEVTGNVSYVPENHQAMTDLRQAKIDGIDVPDLVVDDPDGADLLVLGWGSTYPPIRATVNNLRRNTNAKVAQAHLRHLRPFPKNLGEVLGSYEKILIPELNTGQLRYVLRAEYLVAAEGLNKVSAEPFKINEIKAKILEMLG
jgi:2-oxoglutarate ferredoxin oxidoreductase subunit alpha